MLPRDIVTYIQGLRYYTGMLNSGPSSSFITT
jgi:hypothetical protein